MVGDAYPLLPHNCGVPKRGGEFAHEVMNLKCKKIDDCPIYAIYADEAGEGHPNVLLINLRERVEMFTAKKSKKLGIWCIALLAGFCVNQGDLQASCHCIGHCQGDPGGAREVDTCVADGSACTADVVKLCNSRNPSVGAASSTCTATWDTTGRTPSCTAQCVDDGVDHNSSASDGSVCLDEAIARCEGHGGVEQVIWRDGDPIPTVSEWAAIGMTLLLMTAGTIVFFRKRGRGTAVA